MERLQIIDSANFTLHLTLTGSIVIKRLFVVSVGLFPSKRLKNRCLSKKSCRYKT